jgi:uncharacterized protein YdaU (DUF1376 family)
MHYYPHHIGDFLRDTSSLSPRDSYIYLRLIWLYYESEKPLPDDPEVLAYKVGVRGEEQLISLLLRTFFRYDMDLKSHTHQRIDKEIAKYQRKANSARQANQTRWASEDDLKSDTKSDARQIATNNQEPRTTNQQPENQEPKVKRQQAIACPSDVDQQVWGDWVQLRKTKRATVTQTVIDGARNEAEKAGMSLSDFLAVWCRRGSQGLEASWLKPNERQKPIADKYDWLRSDTQVIDME